MIAIIGALLFPFVHADLADGVFNHWNFDLSTENLTTDHFGVLDATDNNFHGVNSTTTTVAGVIDTALSFDGGDYVSMGDVWNFTTENLTICAMTYADSFVNNRIVLGNGEVNAIALRQHSGSYMVGDNGGFWYNCEAVNTGAWVGVCVQYINPIAGASGRDSLRIYFNNATDSIANKVGSCGWLGTWNGGTDNANLSIGASAKAGGPENQFVGDIDELTVWSRILSESEITEWYVNVTAGVGYPWATASGGGEPVYTSEIRYLHMVGKNDTWIKYSHQNPGSDHDHTEIFKDGVYVGDITNPYYNFTGLTADTCYNFTFGAVSTSGNKANNKSVFDCTLESGYNSFYDDINAYYYKPLLMQSIYQDSNGSDGGEAWQQVFTIDINQNNQNVAYACTDTTRCWRTVDGGLRWTYIARNVSAEGATSIVSDPNNANYVFAWFGRMATGYPDSVYNGLYKSTDGGWSWTEHLDGNDTVRQKNGQQIFFKSDTSNGTCTRTVYAGSESGLYNSTDCGDTWSLHGLEGEYINDIDGDTGVVYISTSTDFYKLNLISGLITEPSATGMTTTGNLLRDCATNPSDNQDIICAMTDLYNSTDGGETFTVLYNPAQTLENVYWGNKIMFASPKLIGGSRPYYSTDNGSSFSVPSITVNESVHWDFSWYYSMPIACSADESLCLTSMDGALARSTDQGATWHESSGGMTGAAIFDMHFFNQTHALVAALDYGVYKVDFENNLTTDLNTTACTGGKSASFLAVDGCTYITTCGTWSGSNEDIIRSTDCGDTWAVVDENSEFYTFGEFCKDNKSIVVTSHNYSLDRGATWNAYADDVIASDMDDNCTLYGYKDLGTETGVYSSDDYGASWSAIDLTCGCDGPDYGGVKVNPFDYTRMLLPCRAEGVYEWESGAWTKRAGGSGLPASSNYKWVTYDPNIENKVWTGKIPYASSGFPSLIFLSLDGGNSWNNASNNLGRSSVSFAININPYTTEDIYVTSQGLWQVGWDAEEVPVMPAIIDNSSWANEFSCYGDSITLGAGYNTYCELATSWLGSNGYSGMVEDNQGRAGTCLADYPGCLNEPQFVDIYQDIATNNSRFLTIQPNVNDNYYLNDNGTRFYDNLTQGLAYLKANMLNTTIIMATQISFTAGGYADDIALLNGKVRQAAIIHEIPLVELTYLMNFSSTYMSGDNLHIDQDGHNFYNQSLIPAVLDPGAYTMNTSMFNIYHSCNDRFKILNWSIESDDINCVQTTANEWIVIENITDDSFYITRADEAFQMNITHRYVPGGDYQINDSGALINITSTAEGHILNINFSSGNKRVVTFTRSIGNNGARMDVNVSGNVMYGYCNITNFSYSAMQYTWYKDGVNISSGIYGFGNVTYENATTQAGYGTWNIDSGNPTADANYTSYDYCETGSANCFYYLNLTYSKYLTNVFWLGSYAYGNFNQVLPEGCRSDPIMFRVNSDGDPPHYASQGYCWNSTGWQLLWQNVGASIGYRVFYEERAVLEGAPYIAAGIETNVNNLTIVGPGDYMLSCRGLYETSQTEWINSTTSTIAKFEIMFLNEHYLTPMDTTTIYADFVGLNINKTYTFNTTNGSIEITNLNVSATDEYDLRFYADGFSIRSSFFTFESLSNLNRTSYMLNDSLSDKLDVVVRDYELKGITNATVSVQRFYPNVSSWITVAQGRTNIMGSTRFYVEKDDVYYRFVVEYNNRTIFQTGGNGEIITSDIETYRITTDVSSVYQSWEELDGDLFYTNNTGTPQFVFEYENKAPSVQSVTVEVYKEDEYHGFERVGSSSSTADSDTITFIINDTEDDHISFVYILYDTEYINYLDDMAEYSAPPPAEQEDFMPIMLIVSVILLPALMFGGLYVTRRLIAVPIAIDIYMLIMHFNPFFSLFPLGTVLIIVFGSIPIAYYLNKVTI